MVIISPLHFDFNNIGNNNLFIERYAKILQANKIDFQYLRFKNNSKFWNEIDKSSLFIARYRGIEKDLSLMHSILPEIERRGVKTLPNFNTAYHCGDKLRLSAFYKANSINHPNTFIFFELDDFIDWYNKGDYLLPLVVKLRKGAGSTNVVKINSKSQLYRLGNRLLRRGIRSGMLDEAVYGNYFVLSLIRNYILKPDIVNLKTLGRKIKTIFSNGLPDFEYSCLILQEFIPGNDGDTRITIIGDRAFGFRRFNKRNDFRASGSGLIDYNPKKIDSAMIEFAFNISKKFNFQTMAYDFVTDKDNNPVLLEHNFTYVDTAVANCPVFWKSNGDVVENRNIFPQYWQLVDSLNDKNLKYCL